MRLAYDDYRQERLKVITRILREQKIESQEELIRSLEDHGYFLTQATLSRDLKILKASKVNAGDSGYFYALPSEDELQRREEVYKQDFLRGYVSIEWNDCMVIIKTYSGHAAPVALAIDNMRLPSVIGTIAGEDNNVLVALKKGSSGEQFIEELKALIPEID
ncbi:MAG TPA: ArgR family transcriptional regulator [Spirochaetales bacterium]|nr:ArgR family transcriptional regulator [Spirochaetales bacterium]